MRFKAQISARKLDFAAVVLYICDVIIDLRFFAVRTDFVSKNNRNPNHELIVFPMLFITAVNLLQCPLLAP